MLKLPRVNQRTHYHKGHSTLHYTRSRGEEEEEVLWQEFGSELTVWLGSGQADGSSAGFTNPRIEHFYTVCISSPFMY